MMKGRSLSQYNASIILSNSHSSLTLYSSKWDHVSLQLTKANFGEVRILGVGCKIYSHNFFKYSTPGPTSMIFRFKILKYSMKYFAFTLCILHMSTLQFTSMVFWRNFLTILKLWLNNQSQTKFTLLLLCINLFLEYTLTNI